MFNENRVNILKKGRVYNGPIIYAMARDQRVEDNWALLFSQDLAIKQKQPLIVACPIAADYQDISQRQLNFMIQGLKQVGDKLDKKNIPFIVSSSLVESSLSSLVKGINAGAVVTDFNPLKMSRHWKTEFTKRIKIPFYEIDTHNIVPCWLASDKQEYAAYTFRSKIKKKLNEYL
ncbi:MAG: deoxyribodipyrimidine photo-lyase, partial [bacterium]